ncbi:hypothetical protein [Brucella oryzae]|uniref:Uncharacterized protein n=1 Tax=Brucella oryzae TaxID=335286 RepID=A0A2S7IWD8_9HYPH|nr:hypothetical protein [Brucella oryzae]PQA72322.1 hypothetical protein C3731_17205 [Brucella oryzae]
MSARYDAITKKEKGAWVVHHSQKTASTQNASAEFPALDAAGKASSLLSQFAASEQSVVPKETVDAFARAAGLNPKTELYSLIEMLKKRRVIDTSASGEVSVLGLTTNVTIQHASDIFEEQEPTAEERATIVLAEIASVSPVMQKETVEFISDEFQLNKIRANELLERSETIGFIDGEADGAERIYFNGNLFRRDNLNKVTRVLDSLSASDNKKIAELEALLNRQGCIEVTVAEGILQTPLFEKLRAAGMYDVNHVMNSSGEFGFVTRPAAFHKFNDPMADDAFDLAKALVAALSYGMTLRSAGTGRIGSISALLTKLINGHEIGPATAIGEDYRVLELKGVIQTRPGPRYGYLMKLKKKDIGQMALAVLTTGEAASANAIDRPFEGNMSGYAGPEHTRSDFRRKRQTSESKKLTRDILAVLRTGGTF